MLNGHYVLDKKVLIVINDINTSFYYKLCDETIANDCENSIANSFLGCNDILKYSNESGICENCDINCQGCFGPTESDCYACSINSEFMDDQCLPSSPIVCHPSCITCYGELINNCLSCALPRVLSSDGYCCDLDNGFGLAPVTNVCLALVPFNVCPLGCNFCEINIENGKCLDDILPKIESYALLKKNCFREKNYLDNIDFCSGQDFV